MSGLTTLVLMLRPEPSHAAKRGQEVFREVKTRLQGEGLTLSIKKTVFVVTDGKTRKAMNTIRENRRSGFRRRT